MDKLNALLRAQVGLGEFMLPIDASGNAREMLEAYAAAARADPDDAPQLALARVGPRQACGKKHGHPLVTHPPIHPTSNSQHVPKRNNKRSYPPLVRTVYANS